jgi:hypothetical protein
MRKSVPQKRANILAFADDRSISIRGEIQKHELKSSHLEKQMAAEAK